MSDRRMSNSNVLEAIGYPIGWPTLCDRLLPLAQLSPAVRRIPTWTGLRLLEHGVRQFRGFYIIEPFPITRCWADGTYMSSGGIR